MRLSSLDGWILDIFIFIFILPYILKIVYTYILLLFKFFQMMRDVRWRYSVEGYCIIKSVFKGVELPLLTFNRKYKLRTNFYLNGRVPNRKVHRSHCRLRTYLSSPHYPFFSFEVPSQGRSETGALESHDNLTLQQ
jgi:hypothetical protein